jgi:hypothetical protein
MSITSLSSTVTASASEASSAYADRRKNIQALDSALQSGDLQAAQSASAALQQTGKAHGHHHHHHKDAAGAPSAPTPATAAAPAADAGAENISVGTLLSKAG